jgi:hypothetical protein
MTYKINKTAKPYLRYVGQEKTPIFILDNFLQNLSQSMLQNLEQLVFEPSNTFYPGIQAKLPDKYILTVANAIVPLLYKIYEIPIDYKVTFFDSYYSLITSEPRSLSIEQQIPHFDGTDKYRFALLHYLSEKSHGGTAFYRHVNSDFERINEFREVEFLRLVSHYYKNNPPKEQRYINDNNTQFTKIGEIPFVQNRLAIYPGNLLHSGLINPSTDIQESPASGRLTANIFLNFVSPDIS